MPTFTPHRLIVNCTFGSSTEIHWQYITRIELIRRDFLAINYVKACDMLAKALLPHA